jgi:hypothetical protein
MHKYKEFNFKDYKLKFTLLHENPENMQYFITSLGIQLQTNKSIYKIGVSKSDNKKVE